MEWWTTGRQQYETTDDRTTKVWKGGQHKEVDWIQLWQVHYENKGQNKLEDHCSQPSEEKRHRMMVVMESLQVCVYAV